MNPALNPASRNCLRLMRCVCVLICCLCTSFLVFPQAPVQSSAIILKGPLGETVNAVVTDASGNSYFTGMFSGTVDVDPGSGVSNLTANGATDVFILKLNASGGLVWARSFGSEEPELGASIALDALGNIYVTGNFSAAMKVGSITLSTNGSNDAYLVKLDALGNYTWARAWGGTGSDGGSCVHVDPNNNVYVAGTFTGTVSAYRLNSAGAEDVFLIKMDALGNSLWAGSIGGTGYETVGGLVVDALGNAYFGGVLVGSGDLDPGAGVFAVSAPPELEQAYIVKANTNGGLLWAKTIRSDQGSKTRNLKLDKAGNLYCLGSFFGTADLDPGPANLAQSSQGDEDIFLLKMDASGQLMRSTVVGGPTQDFALGLFLDNADACYLGGTFSSTVDFDPGAGSAPLTDPGIGTFLLKLDSSGKYVYASQIQGTFVRVITDLATVAGKIYLTGFFSESVQFNGTTYYTDDLSPDAVVFVYDQPAALPVTFLRFEASANNQHAQLEWWTSMDNKVAQLIVERSVDGVRFEAIAKKPARKNGRINKYEYTDPNRLSGTVYYRIKAVGADGSFAYSAVRTVTLKPVIWVKVYPNPAKGVLIINANGLSQKLGRITVGFYNRAGVLVRTCQMMAGSSQVIRLNGIPAGLYTLKMTAPGFSYSEQVIVQ